MMREKSMFGECCNLVRFKTNEVKKQKMVLRCRVFSLYQSVPPWWSFVLLNDSLLQCLRTCWAVKQPGYLLLQPHPQTSFHSREKNRAMNATHEMSHDDVASEQRQRRVSFTVFHCNYWDCSWWLGCTYNASWPVTLTHYPRVNRKHLMHEWQCQQMFQQLSSDALPLTME